MKDRSLFSRPRLPLIILGILSVFASADAARFASRALVPGSLHRAPDIRDLRAAAGSPVAPDDRLMKRLYADPAFVEPVAGVRDADGSLRRDVRYIAHFRDARVYVRSDGLSFVFPGASRRRAISEATGGVEDPAAAPVSGTPEVPSAWYRVDMRFDGANPSTAVSAADPRPDVENVYSAARPDGVTGLRRYRTVVFTDLYPHIDARFTIVDGGVKYAFIVHPGGNAADIAVSFPGASTADLDAAGMLRVGTPVATLTDARPAAWLTDDSGKRRGPAVPTSPAFDGRTLRFATARYDGARTLVIDPFLQWSTFYGGTASDYPRSVATDAQDNVYIAGYTMSTDFPVTTGAFQTKIAGSLDAFVVKFDARLQRVWATYYGGTDEEQAMRLAIDRAGDPVITGYTASIDFPITSGCFQAQNNGKNDIFLLKLQQDGSRQWATYFGGGLSDECTDIAIGKDNQITITGGTYSTNFPVSMSAYQKTNGGEFDCFLARFTPAGQRAWATYIGGWGMDYATSVAVTDDGQAVFCGYSESSNFPVTKDALQQTYSGGQYDMIVARFSGAGERKWVTYLGGKREDRATALALRKNGTIVVAGQTASEPFQGVSSEKPGRSGTLDAVVMEIDARGAVSWTSRFGGQRTEIVTDIAVDEQENTIVTGYTESADFPSTPTSFRKKAGGGYDGFLAVLNGSGQRTWSTLIGGRDQDIPYGISMDRAGNAFLAGMTMSGDFPTTPNAFQKSKAGYSDGFLCRVVFNVPIANAGPDTAACVGAGVEIGRSAARGRPPYSYSWKPSTGLSAADIMNPFASPKVTTSYEVTVTDAEGATAKDTVVVSVNEPPKINAGRPVSICRGSIVTIGGLPKGGRPPYSYAWSPAEGLNSTSIATPAAHPEITTTYSVSVTDKNGCVGRDSVTITVYPAIIVACGIDQSMCAGAETVLHPSVTGGVPPYEYRWQPGTGLSSASAREPAAHPAQTTEYILTVTDAKGCSSSDTMLVRVNPAVAVDAGADAKICHNGATRIGAAATGGAAPYSYMWTPSAGLNATDIATPTAAPAVTTRYTVVATDANGCTASDSVLVSVTPPLRVNAGADASICEGSGTQLGEAAQGGTPPYTYSWIPAAGLTSASTASPTASPRKSTRYIMTVTDALGCSASDSVQITVTPVPVAKCEPDVTLCRGTRKKLSTSVKGGRAPYRYHWSPQQGLSDADTQYPTASPDQTTTYIFTVTDANGCTASDSILVTVRPCSKADAGPDVELCAGSEIALGGTDAEANEEPAYSWSPKTGLKHPTSLHATASPSATTSYVLTVTNRFGCVSHDTATVAVHPVPRANAGDDITLCEGGGAIIGRLATGGTPPYTYAWDPADGLTSAAVARPYAAPKATTTYTVTVTDADHCTSSATATVRVAPKPHAEAGADRVICAGTATQLGDPALGDRGPFVYRWSPSEGLENARSPAPIARPRITTTYLLTVTTPDGCQEADSVTITVRPTPQPSIHIGGPTAFCEGESVTLDAPEGFLSYRWTDGSAGRSITVTASGTYAVTVTDGNGCSGTSDPVTVRVAPVPRARVIALGPLRFCEGETVTLDAGDGFASYAWSTGQKTRTIDVRETGAYAVTVANAQGCASTSDTARVEVLPRPAAHIDRRSDTLLADVAPTYQWLRNGKAVRGAVNREYIAPADGRFAVTTGNGRCTATSEDVEVVFGTAVVGVGRVTAHNGDSIGVPLLLTGGKMPRDAYPFEARIRFNRSQLIPDRALPEETDGDEAVVTVRGKRRLGTDTLAVVPFQIAARRGRVRIVLESLRWTAGLVKSTLRNGEILVTRD